MGIFFFGLLNFSSGLMPTYMHICVYICLFTGLGWNKEEK